MAPGDTESEGFMENISMSGCKELGPCVRYQQSTCGKPCFDFVEDPCEDCPFVFEDNEDEF